VAIALDVGGGKVYYTTDDDWSVKRANLDGTGVENLYTSASGTPHGIALDLSAGKVYFTDNYSAVQKIQRMNLDGTGLEDVLTGVQAVAIALYQDPTAVGLRSFAARSDFPLPVLGLVLGLSALLLVYKRWQ
jgi:DNA-binding beta-propeller fold protein YncE